MKPKLKDLVNYYWKIDVLKTGKKIHCLRIDGLIFGSVDQIGSVIETKTLHFESCPNGRNYRTLKGAKNFVESEAARFVKSVLEQSIKNIQKDENYADLRKRLSDGHNYLMEVEPRKLNVEDALEAFGFGRNGLNF